MLPSFRLLSQAYWRLCRFRPPGSLVSRAPVERAPAIAIAGIGCVVVNRYRSLPWHQPGRSQRCILTTSTVAGPLGCHRGYSWMTGDGITGAGVGVAAAQADTTALECKADEQKFGFHWILRSKFQAHVCRWNSGNAASYLSPPAATRSKVVNPCDFGPFHATKVALHFIGEGDEIAVLCDV